MRARRITHAGANLGVRWMIWENHRRLFPPPKSIAAPTAPPARTAPFGTPVHTVSSVSHAINEENGSVAVEVVAGLETDADAGIVGVDGVSIAAGSETIGFGAGSVGGSTGNGAGRTRDIAPDWFGFIPIKAFGAIIGASFFQKAFREE